MKSRYRIMGYCKYCEDPIYAFQERIGRGKDKAHRGCHKLAKVDTILRKIGWARAADDLKLYQGLMGETDG